MPTACNCILSLRDCRGGLEGDPQDDVLPIRDATLHSPRSIRPCPDVSILDVKLVVVSAPQHARASKAATNLEPLGRQRSD